MSQLWRVIANGARWVWKNSWWIIPAGETIYNQVKEWFQKRKTAKDEKQPNT